MSSKRAIPHFCPKCKAEGEFYGRLVFGDEELPVKCPYHKGTDLAPSQREKK